MTTLKGSLFDEGAGRDAGSRQGESTGTSPGAKSSTGTSPERIQHWYLSSQEMAPRSIVCQEFQGAVVIDSRYRKLGARRLFGDCMTCADVIVPTLTLPGRGRFLEPRVQYLGDLAEDLAYAPCPSCGGPARLRAVALRTPRTPTVGVVRGALTYCGGVCLNGRRSCDCSLCRGRCHGAGKCPGH